MQSLIIDTSEPNLYEETINPNKWHHLTHRPFFPLRFIHLRKRERVHTSWAGIEEKNFK